MQQEYGESSKSEIEELSKKYPEVWGNWGEIEEKNHKGEVINKSAGLVIGRPGKQRVIKPEDIENLARLHCTWVEMSDYFNIPIETLKYRFRVLVTKAQVETKQALRKAQIKAALGGNTSMQIWLGKNILGQSDQPVNTDATQILPWLDE